MNNNKSNSLTRITVTAESSLLDSVQQHRRELVERTGLRISTSAAVLALIRAGIEAAHNKTHQ